ncbi:MAG: transposase [Proteobacteria bacterium]|nr:transposase [Pseudomonadota bacterium]MBU4298137.1 transposase [Pseudomonadota bacterium]
MVIHTFGDYARWHPHIHVLIGPADCFAKTASFMSCRALPCNRFKKFSEPRYWRC